jgi:hypothetical protein
MLSAMALLALLTGLLRSGAYCLWEHRQMLPVDNRVVFPARHAPGNRAGRRRTAGKNKKGPASWKKRQA